MSSWSSNGWEEGSNLEKNLDLEEKKYSDVEKNAQEKKKKLTSCTSWWCSCFIYFCVMVWVGSLMILGCNSSGRGWILHGNLRFHLNLAKVDRFMTTVMEDTRESQLCTQLEKARRVVVVVGGRGGGLARYSGFWCNVGCCRRRIDLGNDWWNEVVKKDLVGSSNFHVLMGSVEEGGYKWD